MRYIIDFHTGVTKEHEGDLESAKQEAFQGISLTHEPVSILSEKGKRLTQARWFGCEADQEDLVLADYGVEGFYQIWDDEIE